MSSLPKAQMAEEEPQTRIQLRQIPSAQNSDTAELILV